MPIAGWGFAPALAAGNAVVLKPAELTPLTAIRLGELALEAGLPEGVFTVLPGKGSVVGERFVTHPAVRKVCFTGSTAVGQRIMRGAADQVKRVTLELGGKSANIVFADSDLEKAAATAPYGVFDNAGQDCCARSRILVAAQRLRPLPASCSSRPCTGCVVGAPGDEATEMGPLISAGQRETVRSYVEESTAGRRRLPWRRRPTAPGYWYPPTVVLPRGTNDRVWREEVFGPVVAVLPFDDEADAVAMANDTAYGLSGSIWTRDVGRALRVARGVEAGNLSVNSHASCATPRRSAGSSSPASVASSDRTRWTRSPRSRTSSSPRRPEADSTQHGGWLEGRVAVVTGGCSGIGLATARRFAQEGAKVVDRRPRRHDGRARRGRGRRPFVHCDVTDAEQVEALFGDAQRRPSAASTSRSTTPGSPPRRRLDPQHGPRRLAAGAGGQPHQRLPLLQGRAALHARAGAGLDHQHGVVRRRDGRRDLARSPTRASKGGVLAMSRELGVQFAREGIRVNALCPGPVNTPLLRELFAKDPERAARRLVHIRWAGSPSPTRSPDAVLFLASDDSSFITASTVPRRRRHQRRLRHPAVSRLRRCAASVRRPVIGHHGYVEPALVGGWRDVPAVLVPLAYVRHVERAGGLRRAAAAARRRGPTTLAARLLARLDGAGARRRRRRRARRATAPSRTRPSRRPTRPRRDRARAGAARADRDVPLLGVCRGMQVMAVAAGGSLEQHLPDRVGHDRHARPRVSTGSTWSHRRRHPAAPVLGERGVGADLPPPGLTHPGFVECGWARTVTLEAVEDPDARFRLGVQWHPEVGDDPRLFEALVRRPRAWRSGRG